MVFARTWSSLPSWWLEAQSTIPCPWWTGTKHCRLEEKMINGYEFAEISSKFTRIRNRKGSIERSNPINSFPSIYLHPARAVAACCSSPANRGLWLQLPVLGARAGKVEPSPSSCAGKPTPTTSWKPARWRIPLIWRLLRWARLKSAWPAR